MRGPHVGLQRRGPRGSGSRVAFLGGPVPRDPPRKGEGAPGQPPGLPHRGPWKAGGSSGPQGGPRDWCGVGPRETRENSAPAADVRGGAGAAPSHGLPAVASPAPGGPQAGQALRWGRAGSAGHTGSGGGRGGAGRRARPGTPRPDPPGSPRSARRWAGGFRRTPGPPLGGARGCDLGQEALPATCLPPQDPRDRGAGPRPAQPQGPPG